MGLRDLLKKKDGIERDGPVADGATYNSLAVPDVRFIRSDTFSQEEVHPPGDHRGQHDYLGGGGAPGQQGGNFLSAREAEVLTSPASSTNPARRSIFSSSSRSRGSSVSSRPSSAGGSGGGEQQLKEPKDKESRHKRLSQRLHLARSPPSSDAVPQDLPAIVVPQGGGGDGAEGDDVDADEARQAQWEKRATILASANEKLRSATASPAPSSHHHGGGGNGGGGGGYYVGDNVAVVPPSAPAGDFRWLNLEDDNTSSGMMGGGGGGFGNGGGGGMGGGGRTGPGGRPRSPSMVSSKAIDEDIQEAIRLHEAGELAQSTRLFGRLADPEGANNPLSQVLYGLALRHGWGCEPDPAGAVTYLSKAASNAAAVERLALQAGMNKGGAAKGELVLAIFELANCFRHGWGVEKDPVAAKQYYETAANLGDTDAMNEAAWCYLEGHGCKKDKFAAAKYYRLAEKNGNKILGNSWIWKDKYDPDYTGKKK